MRIHHARRASLVFGAILLIAWAPAASALTINGTFGGSAAPGGTTGGGTLTAIFDWAAAQWEALIPDVHVLSVNYDWGPLGGSTLGLHTLNTQGGVPNRETSATLTFDNDGSQGGWFLDATPGDPSEYGSFLQTNADLGGGVMSTGLVYTGAMGGAAGQLDLVSVVLHEIGHALGLSAANTSFAAENGDLDVDITSGIFAGAVLPTVSGAHLNLLSASLFPSVGGGTRTLISDADLMANCQISQFAECLSGRQTAPIPEPAAGTLFAIGVLVAAVATRRRA